MHSGLAPTSFLRTICAAGAAAHRFRTGPGLAQGQDNPGGATVFDDLKKGGSALAWVDIAAHACGVG
jgi:hypothetical protein